MIVNDSSITSAPTNPSVPSLDEGSKAIDRCYIPFDMSRILEQPSTVGVIIPKDDEEPESGEAQNTNAGDDGRCYIPGNMSKILESLVISVR